MLYVQSNTQLSLGIRKKLFRSLEETDFSTISFLPDVLTATTELKNPDFTLWRQTEAISLHVSSGLVAGVTPLRQSCPRASNTNTTRPFSSRGQDEEHSVLLAHLRQLCTTPLHSLPVTHERVSNLRSQN